MDSAETIAVSSTLSWNTFLSRTSVSTLTCAAFSDQTNSQVHGLDDVLKTVRALDLEQFRYEEIQREEFLGQGETFLVEKCVLQNKVFAIKYLKTNQSPDDTNFRRRLKSIIFELRIMRHPPLRNHPNILEVSGYGWHTNNNQIMPYILVQYAPYGTLRQYLGRFKDVSLRAKELLLGDVASAISALHRCGIIHGDVKLDNVLVFHSWDRPAKAIAKAADFGHSLVIGDGRGNESTNPLRYGGTLLYNAPEVQTQDFCPIDRADLHKCDVWSFGLLAWELFLNGEEYFRVASEASGSGGGEGRGLNYSTFLQISKQSIPLSRSSLFGSMLRSIFNMTLQVDPCKRISDLTKLPIMSRWHSSGVQGVIADLVLHLGRPDWSYEMFRPENGKEIGWEHEEQIFTGLRRIVANSRGQESAAPTWQLALCYHLGFGVAANPDLAYRYAETAKNLQHPLALHFSHLLRSDESLDASQIAKDYRDHIVELQRKVELGPNTPPLLAACMRGDMDVVARLLKSGTDIDSYNIAENTIYHWLFMFDFDKSTLRRGIPPALIKNWHKAGVNVPCSSTFSVHDQFPLQLTGSPLAFAVSINASPIVQHLLSLGADPLARAFAEEQFPDHDHRSKWTPLHIAVKYHCSDILSLLLAARKSKIRQPVPLACALSFSSSLERLAMHRSGRRKALDATIAIIKDIEPLTASTADGMTALLQAIDFHDADVVSALLRAEPKLASAPFRKPQNPDLFNLPIHFAAQLAARRDTPEAVQILEMINSYSHDLDRKKPPPRDSEGRTPLHLSVTGPSNRATAWLIERKPELLHIEDKSGRSPLHCCASVSNCEVLMAHGAAVNHTDKFGMTALHTASSNGNTEIVQSLLKHKPILDLKNNHVGTALHCAIVRGSSDVVMALLEANAPIDAKNLLGDSPIHTAATLCRHSILRILVCHGADIGIRNMDGQTAEQMATTMGTVDSLRTLHILRGGLLAGNDMILYDEYPENNQNMDEALNDATNDTLPKDDNTKDTLTRDDDQKSLSCSAEMTNRRRSKGEMIADKPNRDFNCPKTSWKGRLGRLRSRCKIASKILPR